MSSLCSSSYSDWYENTYPQLTGNGLWLAGNELNTLDIAEFDKRNFRILITRLSTYFDTAESFSHYILYQIAKREPDMFPDLAYLPPVHDIPIFSRDNIPWLLGIATKRGPGDFDCIAISNSIVQELVNVPQFLERSNIPVSKRARMQDQSAPLVILGGSNALYTSLFFTKDPPIDGIFVGESVECITRIFRISADAKTRGISKEELLHNLLAVPGFILPDAPAKTSRFIEKHLDLNRLLTDAPVPNLEDSQGTGIVQISDGCPCFCTFCAESFNKKPYREVAGPEIISQARAQKAGRGLHKIDLYSFNFNMHSDLDATLLGLADTFAGIGLKSQRFDTLAQTPSLMQTLLAVDKTSLTFGLEGVSDRLRRYLHKSLSVPDLESSLSTVLKAPIRELKIFLIITGLETSEDIGEFRNLLAFIKNCDTHIPRCIFSATPLVRFPGTPLEFERAPDPETLHPIQSSVRNTVERAGFEFRMSSDTNDYVLSQILVRAESDKIFQALQNTIHRTGFIYYRSVPDFFITGFVENCIEYGIDMETLLDGKNKTAESGPWTFINMGVGRDRLVKRHENAIESIDTGYCLGTTANPGVCSACGACDDDMRIAITAQRMRKPSIADTLRTKLKSQKSTTRELQLTVRISENQRGLPRAVFAASLAKAILTTCDRFIPWYRGYSRSFFSPKGGQCYIDGNDIITIVWADAGVSALSLFLAQQQNIAAVNALLGNKGELIGFAETLPEWYTLTLKSPFILDPSPYLNRMGCTFLLRKNKDRGYALEFSKQALKKKLISALSYVQSDTLHMHLQCKVSAKFDISAFVQNICPDANQNGWIRVQTTAGFNY